MLVYKAPHAQPMKFHLKHIGINPGSGDDALRIASLFCIAFGFPCKPGNSSVFAGDAIEVMRKDGPGEKGHIAFETPSLESAITYLNSIGIQVNMDTAKYTGTGNLKAVYLKDDFGGFAVHLLKKEEETHDFA